MTSPRLRLFFRLNNLEEKIIKEKMKEHGMEYETDFDKYLQKVLSHEIEITKFEECDTFSCKVEKQSFNKSMTKKKMNFIQCIANKNSTTISSAIATLLIKGFPKQ